MESALTLRTPHMSNCIKAGVRVKESRIILFFIWASPRTLWCHSLLNLQILLLVTMCRYCTWATFFWKEGMITKKAGLQLAWDRRCLHHLKRAGSAQAGAERGSKYVPHCIQARTWSSRRRNHSYQLAASHTQIKAPNGFWLWRPNKKIYVVLVIWPSLVFTPPTLNFFFQFSKSTYLVLPSVKLFFSNNTAGIFDS
jgi:hypothetical protein